MNLYEFIKIIHIISSTVLFGTGLGIAFFMFCTKFTDNIHEKFFAIRTTVLADYLFTVPAVIIQPLTGFWLVIHAGFAWTDTWLIATYVLYFVAGLCWLPVVWIQIRLKQILKSSVSDNSILPPEYHKLFRLWFILGWPAFIGLVAVYFLMVIKPS